MNDFSFSFIFFLLLLTSESVGGFHDDLENPNNSWSFLVSPKCDLLWHWKKHWHPLFGPFATWQCMQGLPGHMSHLVVQSLPQTTQLWLVPLVMLFSWIISLVKLPQSLVREPPFPQVASHWECVAFVTTFSPILGRPLFLCSMDQSLVWMHFLFFLGSAVLALMNLSPGYLQSVILWVSPWIAHLSRNWSKDNTLNLSFSLSILNASSANGSMVHSL